MVSGSVPGVRVHGDGPAPRDQEGQHTQGHPQTVHHVPTIQGQFYVTIVDHFTEKKTLKTNK